MYILRCLWIGEYDFISEEYFPKVNGWRKIYDNRNIKKITLFGSRAADTNKEDSDVDLIIEFSISVSLLTLSMIKLRLEEILKVGVDVVHGPIEKSDLIEIGKVVELYAA